MGCSPWSCKELDTTERLTFSLFGAYKHKNIYKYIHEKSIGLVLQEYDILADLSRLQFLH